jgi:hypothetical protein
VINLGSKKVKQIIIWNGVSISGGGWMDVDWAIGEWEALDAMASKCHHVALRVVRNGV